MKFCLKHEWRSFDGFRQCRICMKEQTVEFRSGIRTRKFVCFRCPSVNSRGYCEKGHKSYLVPENMKVPSPRHEARWKAFEKELLEIKGRPLLKSRAEKLLEKWK